MDAVSLRVFMGAAGSEPVFGYSVLGFQINGVAMDGDDIVVVGESTLNPGRIAVSRDDGASWYSFDSLAASTTGFKAVCYGDSKWVAVGVDAIAVSADLQTWSVTTFTSKTFTAVVYGLSQFIAVGNSGIIYTSPDAVTWTQQTSGTAVNLTGVAASDTTVVASTTSGGNVYTSTDGVTWSPVATGVSTQYGIGYGNGVFVLCSTASKYSTDNGATWTATSGLSGFAYSVVWDGTYYIAVGQLSVTPGYRSLDGITWSRSGIGAFSAVSGTDTTVAVATSGGAVVVIGRQSAIIYSTNSLTSGQNITVEPYIGIRSDLYGGVGALYWDGTKYTAISAFGYQFTSTDGRDWSLSTPNFVVSLNYLGYATGLARLTGGTYCALGVDTGFSGAAVATSSDGLTWTARTLGATTPMYDIVGSSTLFVAVGGAGTGVIRTSPDGITWTARTSNASSTLLAVAYADGLGFVAVGPAGVIVSSATGTTWTARTGGLGLRLDAVTYGNGLFVAVGENGSILTSPTGTTWTNRSITTTDDFLCVSWNGAVFVASGPNGTYTSTDSISWRKVSPYGGTSIASAGRYQTVIADQQASILMSPKPPSPPYPS